MMPNQDKEVAQHRLKLFCLGGAAGLALWTLGENWDKPFLPPALYLALFTFVASYSGVALALAGPVSLTRALRGALLIAVPVTVLVSLAGLRHVVPTDVLDQPINLSVTAVLVLIATPFLLVWLQAPTEWRNYGALFDAAWTMTVRYGVAYLFVGVFWLVVFMSKVLFELVGIEVIDWFLRIDGAPFVLSGAVLGLGLAVVYELRQTISPFLILRLLRLLVPVVLVVLAIFLVAVPFRGLSDLFGGLSAGATLMGAAIVAITLINTALDRDDTRAVSTSGLRNATRLLALLLPLLALLAVWAVLLRVWQYGWTPDRVLAATAAFVILAYGIGYGVSVLRGSGWRARVRAVNVVMALAVIGVSALWLTPVLNPFRISANSQIARYVAGKSDLEQLPLWALQNAWGKAGIGAVNRLEGLVGRADQEDLELQIELVRNQSSKYRYKQAIRDQKKPKDVAKLVRLMAVRPEGSVAMPEMFAELAFYEVNDWLGGCTQVLPDGRPGCVLIRGVFNSTYDAENQGVVLFLNESGKARVNFVFLKDTGDISRQNGYDIVQDSRASLSADVIARALDGAFDIRPIGMNALHIGGAVLVPRN
jgi:hypothetical protein